MMDLGFCFRLKFVLLYFIVYLDKKKDGKGFLGVCAVFVGEGRVVFCRVGVWVEF